MDLLADSILPDSANLYLLSLQEKGRLPSTIKRYTYDLEDFFRWLQVSQNCKAYHQWQTVTKTELLHFFSHLQEERKYADKTVKRIHTVLKQYYGYYEQRGEITDNPMKNVKLSLIGYEKISSKDLLSSQEQHQLLQSIRSIEGLSENQLKARPFLVDRNLSIIYLFLYYGLSLKELVSLNMNHIHFETNRLDIPSISSQSRTITVLPKDKKLFYTYYKTIPNAVRPRYHSNDPFFVAFDFQRNTYRWVYEFDQPKALTEIAVQKMIRQELARAGLRKGISAQHLRNTFIIEQLLRGENSTTLQSIVGLRAPVSLKRYVDYVEKMNKKNKPKS